MATKQKFLQEWWDVNLVNENEKSKVWKRYEAILNNSEVHDQIIDAFDSLYFVNVFDNLSSLRQELAKKWWYEEIWLFREWLAKVKKLNKRWFINKDWREIVPLIYDWVDDFSEWLASFLDKRHNVRWYIDKNWTKVLVTGKNVPFRFSEWLAVNKFTDRLSRLWYIDKSWNVVIPGIYTYAKDFSEWLAAVIKEWKLEKRWYIDKNWNRVIDWYQEVSSFNEWLAAVRKTFWKWWYIDKDWKEIIPFEYDKAG